MKNCLVCGVSMATARVDARTCSPRCRKSLSRVSLPARLTSLDRWVRWSSSKVPLTVDGRAASSTNPATWTDYRSARASRAGVGIGFVLAGEGIGCYDLDHCFRNGRITAAAKQFMDSVRSFYVEVSPSGDGLHLWVEAEAAPGWKRTLNGVSVEFYTQGRYMTVTGNRYA